MSIRDFFSKKKKVAANTALKEEKTRKAEHKSKLRTEVKEDFSYQSILEYGKLLRMCGGNKITVENLINLEIKRVTSLSKVQATIRAYDIYLEELRPWR